MGIEDKVQRQRRDDNTLPVPNSRHDRHRQSFKSSRLDLLPRPKQRWVPIPADRSILSRPGRLIALPAPPEFETSVAALPAPARPRPSHSVASGSASFQSPPTRRFSWTATMTISSRMPDRNRGRNHRTTAPSHPPLRPSSHGFLPPTPCRRHHHNPPNARRHHRPPRIPRHKPPGAHQRHPSRPRPPSSP